MAAVLIMLILDTEVMIHMYVLMGAIGAVSALALYWIGFSMGWIVSRKVSPPTMPEIQQDEQQRQRNVQDAMAAMLSYSSDVAYGSGTGGDSDG